MAHWDLLLCPSHTDYHLFKICGRLPMQAAKNLLCGLSIPHVCVQTASFSLAFINKNLLYFHTSKYGRRDGFPHQHSHLGTPWWAPPTFSAISNHQQLVTTSRHPSFTAEFPVYTVFGQQHPFHLQFATLQTSISGFSPKFSLLFGEDFYKQQKNSQELHYPLQTLLKNFFFVRKATINKCRN